MPTYLHIWLFILAWIAYFCFKHFNCSFHYWVGGACTIVSLRKYEDNSGESIFSFFLNMVSGWTQAARFMQQEPLSADSSHLSLVLVLYEMSSYIAQAGIEFTIILLCQPSECWNYNHLPQFPALNLNLTQIFLSSFLCVLKSMVILSIMIHQNPCFEIIGLAEGRCNVKLGVPVFTTIIRDLSYSDW